MEIHHETMTFLRISSSSDSNRNETYHPQHKLEYPTRADKKASEENKAEILRDVFPLSVRDYFWFCFPFKESSFLFFQHVGIFLTDP